MQSCFLVQESKELLTCKNQVMHDDQPNMGNNDSALSATLYLTTGLPKYMILLLLCPLKNIYQSGNLSKIKKRLKRFEK